LILLPRPILLRLSLLLRTIIFPFLPLLFLLLLFLFLLIIVTGSLMVGGTGQFLNDLILFINLLLLLFHLHGFAFFQGLFSLWLLEVHAELHFLRLIRCFTRLSLRGLLFRLWLFWLFWMLLLSHVSADAFLLVEQLLHLALSAIGLITALLFLL
jgi:hypothetical protein